MRKRPWEIVLLTVLYALAPVFNLCSTLVIRGYDLTALPDLVMALGPWDMAELGADLLLAVAVWSVSRPGWWIFVVLNVFLLTFNLWQATLLPESYFLLLVADNVVTTLVASLLFTKHARSPYFSPRLRWWNSQDRYRLSEVVEVPITIRQGQREEKGWVLDVSLTGCFTQIPDGLDPAQKVVLEFSCWGLTLLGQGRIMRQSRADDGLQGCGIQFIGLTNGQKHRFRSLIRTLKANKVPVRN